MFLAVLSAPQRAQDVVIPPVVIVVLGSVRRVGVVLGPCGALAGVAGFDAAAGSDTSEPVLGVAALPRLGRPPPLRPFQMAGWD